jgi:hypothetical protein
MKHICTKKYEAHFYKKFVWDTCVQESMRHMCTKKNETCAQESMRLVLKKVRDLSAPYLSKANVTVQYFLWNEV